MKTKIYKFFFPRRYKAKIKKARKIFRANGLIKQYNAENIGKHFTDFGATFSQIKRGDIKKGEGDFVIVNLKLPDDTQKLFFLFSSINYSYDFSNIETTGIYTNITVGSSFYEESIHAIL